MDLKIVIPESQDNIIEDLLPSDPDRSNSSSIDNQNRIEGLWTKRLQTQLRDWGDTVADNAKGHNSGAKRNKIKARVFGIPGPLATLFIGFIQPYIAGYDLLFAILLAIAACWSGINVACDFSGTRQKHHDAESKYGKLKLKIEGILACPKSNRQAVDNVMLETRLTMSQIAGEAPDL